MRDTSTLKWIIKKSKSQMLKLWLLVFANVIFSVLSVLFAFAIREVINGAQADESNKVLYGAIALGVIVILQFGFRLFINGLSENIRARLDIAFKSAMFSQILNKKYSETNKFHSGELLNRLSNDVTVITDGVANIVPTIASAVTRLVSAVVALVLLDWIFAVAFTVAGALVFTVLALLRGKLKKLHGKTQESEGKTRAFIQESISNLLAIKGFNANDKIEKESNELQEKNFRYRMKRRNYSVLGNATYNLIFSAGYLFALIYGGVQLMSRVIMYGDLSAILQLVNNVQVPFMSLSNIFPQYFSMLSSAERLIEIENLDDEPVKQPMDYAKLYSDCKGIVFDNVTFTYDRDKVLDGGSLYIEKGDFVAIAGISGIGKSTLLKLALGVYPLENGEIYLDTSHGKVPLDNSTRGLFSYVPQGNMLFSGTLKDNVTFVVSDANAEKIDWALKTSCAYDFVQELPNGLDTVIGEKGIGLSEGQVQRIAIARALLCECPIILLDEATSALDEMTEQRLLNNLKELDGVTLIIISHKKAALDICNKRVEIKNKKISLITDGKI